MKKFLYSILAFCMILSLHGVMVYAVDSPVVYTGECGDNLTWSLNVDTEELEIIGTGAMTDYPPTSSGSWGEYSLNIKKVMIGDGVTNIGANAFRNCDRLTSISIGNDVTSIGDGAFYSCDALAIITIPDNVTSIGEAAFFGCCKLSDVSIGTGVINIGDSAFYDCDSIIDIAIPDSVINIEDWAFYGCSYLKNATIGNNVESIGDNAFSYCENLASIVFPNSLKTVGVYAFDNCTNVSDIVFGSGLKKIGYNAFSNCDKVTKIDLPASLIEIGSSSFSWCDALETVVIPGNVNSIGSNAFLRCMKLKKIEVAEENNFYYSDEFGVLFDKHTQTLIKYPSGSEAESYVVNDRVKGIAEYAFDYSRNINAISIHNNLEAISSSAFYGCTGLTDIYYYGGEDDWTVKFPLNSENLNGAILHFNVTSKVAELKSISVSCVSDYFFENPGTDFVVKEAGESDKNFIVREELAKIYRISMFVVDKNNNKIENATGKFTVKMPIPEDFKDCTIVIVHWLSDGTYENNIYMPQWDEQTQAHYVEFLTTSFSEFEFCVNFGFSQETLELYNKQTAAIPATNEPSLNVLYSSSAPEIVSIDENGNITAHGKGSAIITATLENGDGTKFEDTCTVSVVNSFEIPDDILELDSLEIVYTRTASLTTTADENVPITYSSSNMSVATVDENGNITTHGKGTATITATIVDDFGETYTDTCEVTVKFTFWQWLIYIFLLGFLWY